MAKIQTRRAISISGESYKRLREFCKSTNRTMSGTVEGLLKALLSGNGTTKRDFEEILNGSHLEEKNLGLLEQFFPKASKEIKKVEKTSQEIEALAEREVSKATKARERGALYNGEKAPELDPLTKAIRKANEIFTF